MMARPDDETLDALETLAAERLYDRLHAGYYEDAEHVAKVLANIALYRRSYEYQEDGVDFFSEEIRAYENTEDAERLGAVLERGTREVCPDVQRIPDHYRIDSLHLPQMHERKEIPLRPEASAGGRRRERRGHLPPSPLSRRGGEKVADDSEAGSQGSGCPRTDTSQAGFGRHVHWVQTSHEHVIVPVARPRRPRRG